ncbi:ketoacyl-ACP synthase III [Halobacteriovorax sp. GB3]|uniref:3-oxoacyl-ACP synthase III family protein n=1 Tax=Halobacteriovorax sp. GB3 TaxID=2719615 RepID=UPI0023629046|nr:beta-ketoacyl-ACP synthase III [Halobacteriovorax sp. GB3]MDD0853462.1 ketoacyl-ACP synthase III [Halobacteriovorax sp. GB3]
MNYKSRIAGVGGYVPENVFKNTDLEKMLDTSDEWIVQRTGIEQRHWVSKEQSTSDLALKATEEALADAGIDKSEIDMIVFATLSPDHDFPGAGCFLQAKLGLSNIPAFDIRQQCSGFIYAMSMADQYLRCGTYKNILVIGAEIHSKGLDKTPNGRGVSVLFGDGAGAVILQRTEVKDPSKDGHILVSHLHADGKYAKELWLPAPGTGFPVDSRINEQMLAEGAHYASMNGKTVFVHATKRMAETLLNSCKEVGVELSDIDLFLFHQANLRINSKVAEILGIPEEKVFNTIQKYGNTTAATIPLGMRDAVKAGALKRGMLVASAAFGSGFTWGSSIYRY